MNKIFINGNVITMDEKNPLAEAVCVSEGKIKFVGNNEDALKLQTENSEIVDLNHKTMLPGFIDGHSHFVAVANSLSQCDLSQATSFDEIVDALKNFIQKNNVEKGQWVTGVGYDHNFLTEKKHPTKEVLDRVSKDHPIMIVHASSHMGVANTKAFETLNITDDVKNLEGGKYGRDENGKLTGYMEETVFIEFQKKTPMISTERLLQLLVEAQKIYASHGITTIQDGFVTSDLYQLLNYAASQNLLMLDVIGYIDIAQSREVYIKDDHQYHHHLKMGGYKLFLDGSPQGKTAWMLEPYKGEETYKGYPVLTDDALYQLIQTSLQDKAQLLAHCNGDAASEQYITQFEKVMKDHNITNSYRPVMIHAQLVRAEQLKRMKPIHMMPSFFIAHTYFWGDIHIENFGLERASHISPAKSASDLHIPYTFHQDAPVIAPDMLKTIWCATNRVTKNGVSIGKDQCIGIHDALKAITINGAYQYFEEDIKGSIEVGKLADLVIIDQDIQNCDPKNIDQINILETIKEGKTVYQKGN